MIKGLEHLPKLGVLCLEDVYRFITLKCRTIDASNYSAQRGVVVEVSKAIGDVGEPLNLFRTHLWLVVA